MLKCTLHTYTHIYSAVPGALWPPSVSDPFFCFNSSVSLPISCDKPCSDPFSTIHAAVLMAAPPMKSQPLHNFSLPHLKWAHKNSSSASGSSSHQHRFRRRDSPDQHRHRYPDPESDPETRPTNPKRPPPPGSSRNDSALTAADEENGEAKPWKLRPRKEVIRAASTCKKETGAENNNNNNKTNSNSNGVKSQRLRGLADGGQQNGGVERKTKRKVWISLSREEIEEDVYALTGGKPPRRPKKWPKNVQKQLETVFPGLYLVGVAADSYRALML